MDRVLEQPRSGAHPEPAETTAARSHHRWGGPRQWPGQSPRISALAGAPASPPPRRRRLELPSRAGLHIVPTLAEFLQQPRLLDLPLEEFEGVLQAIALVEPNFYH